MTLSFLLCVCMLVYRFEDGTITAQLFLSYVVIIVSKVVTIDIVLVMLLGKLRLFDMQNSAYQQT